MPATTDPSPIPLPHPPPLGSNIAAPSVSARYGPRHILSSDERRKLWEDVCRFTRRMVASPAPSPGPLSVACEFRDSVLAKWIRREAIATTERKDQLLSNTAEARIAWRRRAEHRPYRAVMAAATTVQRLVRRMLGRRLLSRLRVLRCHRHAALLLRASHDDHVREQSRAVATIAAARRGIWRGRPTDVLRSVHALSLIHI